jgi:hypothetical protein
MIRVSAVVQIAALPSDFCKKEVFCRVRVFSHVVNVHLLRLNHILLRDILLRRDRCRAKWILCESYCGHYDLVLRCGILLCL